MKKYFLNIFVLFLMLIGENVFANDKKVLVVYYSYSGNTKKVAEAINKEVNGDLFEIKAEENYSSDYNTMTEEAKKQIQSKAYPKLLSKVNNIQDYDVIFLGSPNWWGTIAPQVSSFLKEYDLSGKTIIPFITNGGGGVQRTISDMTSQCSGCKVSKTPWIGYGNETGGISKWLESLI